MAKKSQRGVLSDAAGRALREVEKCSDFHDRFVTRYRERDEAFRGVMKASQDAASWESTLHPPYVNHIVETTVAALVDDKFAYRIRPKARLFNPGEFERAQEGAKAHEALFSAQMCEDGFEEFLRPFSLIAAVQGMAVAKTYWRADPLRTKKRLRLENAAPPELAALGAFVPQMVEEDYRARDFDGPVTECVDLRDFYWHEAAVSLEQARWVAHAVWMSVSDLRKFEQDGHYRNVGDLDANPNEAAPEDALEQERERRGRRRDMVEVLEIWDREQQRVFTLGGRRTVLREADWPFWHGKYPFTVASLQPYPFSLQGMGIVEKIEHLQEAAWDMMNQRHTGLRFLMNPVFSIRPEAAGQTRVWEPGALWLDDDPQSITQLPIDPTPVNISLPAEEILKKTMQDLSQSQPFTTTGQARDVGADTATEAALVTTLAQQAAKQMKRQVNIALKKIGHQRMLLNQQFIREETAVAKAGIDDREEIVKVMPYLLRGDYLFDTEPMNESLMRNERRAERNTVFQILMQSAPVLSALGTVINGKAALADLLKEYGVDDVERYLQSQPPPGMQQQGPAGQGGGGQQQQAVAGPHSQGVTAQQSIDPAVSPSASDSMSGAAALARLGAMNGGANNV